MIPNSESTITCYKKQEEYGFDKIYLRDLEGNQISVYFDTFNPKICILSKNDETIIEIKNDKSTATEEQLKLVDSILIRAKNNGLNYTNGTEFGDSKLSSTTINNSMINEVQPKTPKIEYDLTVSFQTIMDSVLEVINNSGTGRRVQNLPDEETLALIGFFNYYRIQLNTLGTSSDYRFDRVSEELEKISLQDLPEYFPTVKAKFLDLVQKGYCQLIPQVSMQHVVGSARTNMRDVYVDCKLEKEPKKFN